MVLFGRPLALALANESAIPAMRPRRVVLLTPSESLHPTHLPSRQHYTPTSPLSATLMDLPVSVANKRLTYPAKSFRCNTYKKHGGRVQTRPARRNSTEGIKLSALHDDPKRSAEVLK